jgi:hypothetical protein
MNSEAYRTFIERAIWFISFIKISGQVSVKRLQAFRLKLQGSQYLEFFLKPYLNFTVLKHSWNKIVQKKILNCMEEYHKTVVIV